MKILITGSEGLIGTKVCKHFKKKNIDIIHYDKKFKIIHYKI